MKLRRLLCQSGVHRLACLSLYRALLKECGRVPLPTQKRGVLKDFIKKRFIKYRKYDSVRITKAALENGYDALSTLHASSTGSEPHTSRIIALLESLPPPKPPRPKPAPNPQPSKSPPSSPPGKPHLMLPHLPRPNLPGKRRIPKLVSACRLPLLRIHRVQPKIISGIIRYKVHRRQAALNREERLEQELFFAKQEDAWDARMEVMLPRTSRSQLGATPEDRRSTPEPEWALAYQESLAELQRERDRWTEEGLVRGLRLWEIVKAERALKAKETAAAKAEEEKMEAEKRTGEWRFRVGEAGLERVYAVSEKGESSSTTAPVVEKELETPSKLMRFYAMKFSKDGGNAKKDWETMPKVQKPVYRRINRDPPKFISGGGPPTNGWKWNPRAPKGAEVREPRERISKNPNTTASIYHPVDRLNRMSQRKNWGVNH